MGIGTTKIGQGWLNIRLPGSALAPARGAPLQGLRMLAFLRTFTPVAQVLTLWVVTHRYGVHVALGPVAVLLAAEALLALATWLRVHRAPLVSPLELLLQAHLDILLFAAMLYFTGGTSNPFAPLFLLPMAITASALAPRWVWVTAISTMVAYAFLREHHVPLFHPAGETEVYDLHEDGMVANYMLTAALLAFFVNRIQSILRGHERMLADARDAQMRSESVVAIGALAAGYAHELSTPLATMSVVVTELQNEHGDNLKLKQDLQVIDDQIKASKVIVSNLANAGGQRRAETAGGERIDQFIRSIVERVRTVHPGATIMTSLDNVTPPARIVVEETLRQAITNLIDNAVRACPSHVEVSADWSAGELVVAVRDRGPGFDAQMLQRLGKQVETTKGSGGGLGLGLMLSAATLERLGGVLELTNEPAGGARAQIRLPLQAILIDTKREDKDASQRL